MQGSIDKIRVLQIIKGLDIGGVNGGAERFSLDLACALDPQKFAVSVCVFFRMQTNSALDLERRLRQENLDFFYTTEWSGNDHYITYLNGIRVLTEYLRRRPADIAHSHFQLGTLATLYLKQQGLAKKAIRTAHISPSREWNPGWYGWLRKQVFSKWAFPLFLDAEIGVSQAIVNEIRQHPGARVFNRTPQLIHNAISIPQIVPEQPKLKEGPIIGVVGRLAEQKGHHYLLKAVALIRDRHPGLQLWIIGDGYLRTELELQTGRLGLKKCVSFLGQRDDVRSLLPHLELLVLPSLWEGLPTIIMESFAQGVPVLATNIPGTRELIRHGETGWLVPPGNSDALAASIHELLNDYAIRERMVKAGLVEVERFTIQSVAKEYANLYLTLLGLD